METPLLRFPWLVSKNLKVETTLQQNSQATSRTVDGPAADYAVRVAGAVDLISAGDFAAKAYLQSICFAARLMDDAVDGDRGPVDHYRLFHVLLVELPANGFFHAHRTTLLPLHSATLNAWQDSDVWLREPGLRRQHALVFRDYLTELGLTVAYLVGGYDHRRAVSLRVRELLFKPET